MNSLFHYTLRWSVLLLVFFLFADVINAQIPPKEPQLVLVNHRLGKVKHLKKGFRLMVKVKGQHKEIKGKLYSVNRTNINVGGQKIALADIEKINGVHWSNTVAEIVGAYLVVGGVITAASGLGLMINPTQDGDAAVGALFLGYGAGLTYIGIIPWKVRHRRRWMRLSWDLVVLMPEEDE